MKKNEIEELFSEEENFNPQNIITKIEDFFNNENKNLVIIETKKAYYHNLLNKIEKYKYEQIKYVCKNVLNINSHYEFKSFKNIKKIELKTESENLTINIYYHYHNLRSKYYINHSSNIENNDQFQYIIKHFAKLENVAKKYNVTFIPLYT